jgi:hypothetical protein
MGGEVGRYLRILDGQAIAEGTAVRTTCDPSDISDQSGGAERLMSLMSLLSPPNPKEEPRAVPDWSDTEEERAAIAEYDGGAPRAWAEALARLDPNKRPGDVPPRRWLRFIDDCGGFLDSGWAMRAAALGWGPLDLFGCNRERPFARLDHQGLMWLVNGGTTIELHRDRAIIETPGGARQSYRRRPVEVGAVVLAWELDR